MARRSSRGRSVQRDDITEYPSLTSPLLYDNLDDLIAPLNRPEPLPYLDPFDDPWVDPLEDRRQFHPEGYFRPATLINGNPSRVYDASVQVERGPIRKGAIPRQQFAFAVPEKVAVCVRRQQRKEVMFALKLAGRGGGKRFRRRNYHSNVRC